MTLSSSEARAAIEQLRRFALFLATEFDGVKPGEWRAPTIGAEAATTVVEAIATLVLAEPDPLSDREQTAQPPLASGPGWNTEDPHAHHLRDLAKTFREATGTHRRIGVTLGRIEALEAGAHALDQLARPTSVAAMSAEGESRK